MKILTFTGLTSCTSQPLHGHGLGVLRSHFLAPQLARALGIIVAAIVAVVTSLAAVIIAAILSLSLRPL